MGYHYRVVRGATLYAGKFSYVPSTPRYKKDASTLFYDVPLGTSEISNLVYTVARESVTAPKTNWLWNAHTGQSWFYVNYYSQWKWDHPGGDWVDANGTSQGTTPICSFSATAVTSGSYTYSVDFTAAVNQSRTANKWNAFIIKSTGTRSWAGRHHATLPPSLFVTYTDSSTETLTLVATSGGWYSGTSYLANGFASYNSGYNGSIEFAKPAKPVQSAVLVFTVLTHTSGASTFSFFLCDPPMGSYTTSGGLSVSYPQDSGILGHANVRFAQLYPDGTAITDVIADYNVGHNITYQNMWSPHMWQPGGATDLTKLPYKLPNGGSGIDITNKWVNGLNDSSHHSIVPSTYTDEGFTPYAPGLGALRILQPGCHAADGAVVVEGNFDIGADLYWYLPEPECGYSDELFTRWVMMVGTYPEHHVANLKMYRGTAGGAAVYQDARGKRGPGPHHVSSHGGNNRIGGGDLGHSSRGIFVDCVDDDPGCFYFGWHCFDMFNGTYKPSGLGPESCVFSGQQGAFGARLKMGQWYDIETRVKLNTWTEDYINNPTYDGIFQMWIDGVLVIDFSGFSYRQGNINTTDPLDEDHGVYHYYMAPDGVHIPPFRELGFLGLWLNDYQGGTIMCEYDLPIFYASIVCATSRIGPFQL